MKYGKLFLLAGVVAVGAAAILTGCSNDSGGSDPGTLTMEFVNADAAVAAGATLEMHVFLTDTDHADPANCVAAWVGSVVSGTFSATMKEDDGAFVPTAVDWIGDGGWSSYSMYILFDFDGDHFITSGSGEKTNIYPAPLLIDGDTSITIDYSTDLIAN